MPRNARCVQPGVPYHVTQRGTNREPVFFTATDRKVYLSLLRDNLADAEVRILAYCLMTNHVHLIIVPGRSDSLAVLMQRVHGRYAQSLNARRQRSGHLWQNRFYSCALSDAHLWVALRYVEQNPVRAVVARSPEEYPWSSARAHLTGFLDRILDAEFYRQSGGAPAWRELHGVADRVEQIYLLRRCTYAGRPFGDEAFVSEMEERFQRRWRRWSFEQLTAAKAIG